MNNHVPYIVMNIFFVPMIAIWIRYRRQNWKMVLSGEFLVRYAVYTCVVSLITECISVVIRQFIGLEYGWDSTYYSLAAICVATILPYGMEAFEKNVKLKCEITKEESKKNEKE